MLSFPPPPIENSREEKELEMRANMEIEGLANYEIGFSKVIEEIIKSKNPLVGHNMFLDILFIYQQFIDDLPPSLSEFIPKVMLNILIL